MSLPTDPIVSTNSATSRSSVAPLVSSQNSGPGHNTAVLRSQNSCEFKSNATAVNHGSISHLPQENSRSVSSSISFLSNSLLIFSTLCCLLSSSRSVFLGSYLKKKRNYQALWKCAIRKVSFFLRMREYLVGSMLTHLTTPRPGQLRSSMYESEACCSTSSLKSCLKRRVQHRTGINSPSFSTSAATSFS